MRVAGQGETLAAQIQPRSFLPANSATVTPDGWSVVPSLHTSHIVPNSQLGKKVKKGCYRGLQTLHCCGRRIHRPPSVHDAEKSVALSSPAVTRTSTTISSPRSPPAPSSPFTDQPPTSTVNTPNPFVVIQTRSQPLQQSLFDPTSLGTIEPGPYTIVTKSPLDGQAENDTVSDLDKIFDEAWQPENDGSDLPWSRSVSSSSAAARYLDDIEDGK
ncbi:hypothetical protein V8F20_012230 [Naviculisporaceae sp. PSN 640]